MHSSHISYLYSVIIDSAMYYVQFYQNMFFSKYSGDLLNLRSAQFDKKSSWCNRQFSLHGLDEILVFVYGLLVFIQQNV